MKKLLMIAGLLCFLAFACQNTQEKESDATENTEQATGEQASNQITNPQEEALNQAKIDQKLIETYLAENEIEANKTSEGIYFEIQKEGNQDKKPDINSNVSVQYVGKLLNGTTFDRSPPDENVSFPLNRVILGWQKGIPLIGEGGEVKLVLPSGMAYGKAAVGNKIPPNSVLVFDVTLETVE